MVDVWMLSDEAATLKKKQSSERKKRKKAYLPKCVSNKVKMFQFYECIDAVSKA